MHKTFRVGRYLVHIDIKGWALVAALLAMGVAINIGAILGVIHTRH